ncbi:hypothetical protein PFISCL1PPCAC_12139, partial [Pristionchus fissidentatus]
GFDDSNKDRISIEFPTKVAEETMKKLVANNEGTKSFLYDAQCCTESWRNLWTHLGDYWPSHLSNLCEIILWEESSSTAFIQD